MSLDGVTLSRRPLVEFGVETERLCARGAKCAVIEWAESDDAIPRRAADIMIRALLRFGRLAFRWDDASPTPAGPHQYFAAPARSVIRRAAGIFSPDDAAAFAVVVTDDPEAARELFYWTGWIHALQAAIIFDHAEDTTGIVGSLQFGLDWRQRTLPKGARILIGSGHDGATALIACETQQISDEFAMELAAGTSQCPSDDSDA